MGRVREAGDLPDWVDEQEYPFARKIVDLGDHRVHVVDEGSGPVLLFVHGNPTWSFVWRRVIDRLSKSFRCVAVDLPGFGLSEAPDGFDGRPASLAAVLGDVVEALDLRGVTLVAHDWGGPIGLRVVEQHPDRFTAIALGNTWAWPITGDRHFERFAGLMGGSMGAWLTRHVNLFVNVMIPVGHRRRRLSAAEMRHYRRALPTPRRREASAILPREITASAEFLADVESRLPQLQGLPMLLVWADRDVAFRVSERERWQRTFPNAEVVEAPGAGHFVPSDAPDDFAAAVIAWHAGLSGPGAVAGEYPPAVPAV